MRTAPWMTLFPGAVIALLILCFNTIGDAVRDELDPRLRLGQHN
jgi:peptide/nickel transport system permease protein